MKATKRILSIKVERMTDECADTSHLGEYSNHSNSDYSMDRDHDSECPCFWIDSEEECTCGAGRVSSRECSYFNPNWQNYKGIPDADIRKYCVQDYERMESLNAGHWYYMGIRAEAEIVINDVSQTITSGGLWGIESDSEADYLKSIEQEELSQLEEQLAALGFRKRAVRQAIENRQAA